jgi:hypothetical protein
VLRCGIVTTTWSPGESPLKIWVCPPLEIPVVTVRGAVLPFVDTVTVDTPFDCVTAFVGTARTLLSCR